MLKWCFCYNHRPFCSCFGMFWGPSLCGLKLPWLGFLKLSTILDKTIPKRQGERLTNNPAVRYAWNLLRSLKHPSDLQKNGIRRKVRFRNPFQVKSNDKTSSTITQKEQIVCVFRTPTARSTQLFNKPQKKVSTTSPLKSPETAKLQTSNQSRPPSLRMASREIWNSPRLAKARQPFRWIPVSAWKAFKATQILSGGLAA